MHEERDALGDRRRRAQGASLALMRVAESTPARLVIEDSGSGFGLVCVLAGHAIAGLAIAKPPYHLWLLIAEIALGLGVAVFGALELTNTRTSFDRVLGDIQYERRNFFGSKSWRAYFYQVEEVFVEQGPREAGRWRADPTQSYAFRPALRVAGADWPLARAYRDHASAFAVAESVRAALTAFAMGDGAV